MAALLLPPTGQAELYKWVDAQGKIHYSDRKDAAGKAQVDAIAHAAAPAAPPARGDAPTWQERERQYQERHARSGREVPAQAARPRRLSQSYGSDQPDTDKSKCELARDVVSGAMRHANGAVTDANDRQIAERDIQNFCR